MQFALLAPLTAASYIGGVNLGGGAAGSSSSSSDAPARRRAVMPSYRHAARWHAGMKGATPWRRNRMARLRAGAVSLVGLPTRSP